MTSVDPIILAPSSALLVGSGLWVTRTMKKKEIKTFIFSAFFLLDLGLSKAMFY
jgi:hypothetical protein